MSKALTLSNDRLYFSRFLTISGAALMIALTLLVAFKFTYEDKIRLTKGNAFAFPSSVSLSEVMDADPTLFRVHLGYAQYEGTYNTATNVTEFLGIRFAAPPIGLLRFSAPQPPLHDSELQLATSHPAQCIQAFRKPTLGSEDCLFLNVYLPADAFGTRSLLPVAVWIHGGGYVLGNGRYSGYDVVRQADYQLIVVTAQYRLGAFGFLAGEAVKSGGALNAGLLDQEFALKWVQNHISSFGGDPDKVTLWGESAGAGSVLHHLVAHGGRAAPPLFRAAILSSVFLPSQHMYDAQFPQALFDKVTELTGCRSTHDALDCLRSVSPERLAAANSAIVFGGDYGTFTFGPVIDGQYIVERPLKTVRDGPHNGDVLLAVSNQFEGRQFVRQTTGMTITQYTMDLYPNIGSARAGQVAALYETLGDTWEARAASVVGESICICPTYSILRGYRNGTAFKSLFAVTPAYHADDVPYYFPGSHGPPPFDSSLFIDAFSQSFGSLVLSLLPSPRSNKGPKFSDWREWKDNHSEMVFNMSYQGEPDFHATSTDMSLLDRCRFWDNIRDDAEI